jgi:hypothetical protein
MPGDQAVELLDPVEHVLQEVLHLRQRARHDRYALPDVVRYADFWGLRTAQQRCGSRLFIEQETPVEAQETGTGQSRSGGPLTSTPSRVLLSAISRRRGVMTPSPLITTAVWQPARTLQLAFLASSGRKSTFMTGPEAKPSGHAA